ncbi:MAG TPA: malto-oligosyltrehalose synthase [Desulfobacteraceae bacterium]|nr:malto-oligosyltrehalose synthase [Desulfobacteraceae bacterium]
MTEDNLTRLASLFGVIIETAGETADPDRIDPLLVSLLARAGISTADGSRAGDVLRREQLRLWENVLDLVLVLVEGTSPLVIPARFAENSSATCRWVLTEENGSRHDGTFNIADLPMDGSFEEGDRRFVRRLINVEVELPCGYHEFTLFEDREQSDTLQSGMELIITPRQCFVPPGLIENNRIWGLGFHLHAVRSKRNWGIGDFSDLKSLLNRAAEQGAGIIHPAPLNDIDGAGPIPLNPYSPSCRCLLNTLFIDPEAVADLWESEEARSRFHDIQFQARLAALRDNLQVDYSAVEQTKREILRLLWSHFSANHLNPETDRGWEFRRFQEQGGTLLRAYGTFCVLRDALRAEKEYTHWSEWPEEFRDPRSQAVADFADSRCGEIEYHQYLQWQADMQLTAVGRRSMERGLKVGMLGELAFSPAPSGFEAWYYRGFFLDGAAITADPREDPTNNPAVGLPLFLAESLRALRFRPFIDSLRQAMRYNGALMIRSLSNYFKSCFSLAGETAGIRTAVLLPFEDILSIIALESRRNNCLVIADNVDLLPSEQQKRIREMNVFTTLSCCMARDVQGAWPPVDGYPANGLISSSAPFLATMKGFWAGRDIALKAGANAFRDDGEKERAIVERAADRAHLLIALDHEQLLPNGLQLDPAAVREPDHNLTAAFQIYLARTTVKIVLVLLNDLLGLDNQAEPPAFPVQRFPNLRYPTEVENIFAAPELLSLFRQLCRERGLGVTRPSAPATDRKKGQGIRLPTAFYRLQLNRDFTFSRAMDIIPYLKELGISHFYASPFLMARPGSPHGYDIIDHGRINPEIGSREEYEQFVAVLEQNRMAMILDVVPNHMGVGSDNQWWMDVLENGEASQYADFFDINWQPQQLDLVGRLLLPVLGDHYGMILESGQIQLRFDADAGSFAIHYHEHRFPVDPGTYPVVLRHNFARLEDRLGKQDNGYLELQNLITSLDNLPGRAEKTEEKLQVRRRQKEVNKRILARICREYPPIRQFIEENVILFNGEPSRPDSFDPLHNLLELQAYRLAFWKVAADEINYRRFFDINDLAGLRMEKLKVFQETHGMILDLIATGRLDGLRIDHPDGLYDPHGYFLRLQAAASGDSPAEPLRLQEGSSAGKQTPLYIVAEKILADFEHLPENWPVHGTTGYDFSNMLNGLFVDASAEKAITAMYHRFIGERKNYDELVYACKKLIIRSSMSGELNVLAGSLYRLAQADRHTRDFRLNRLRDALMEVVACFPVYRTYVSGATVHKSDAQFIEWAVGKAKRREQFDDASVYEFIKNILLLRGLEKGGDRQSVLNFCMKFRQYTGPVMAKGVEDTSFYIYNRLLSLNEVGGEPKRFGTSSAAFHRANRDRLRFWPHSMLNTSTHDSKRSEDVRARINVLSEMPQEWQDRVARWSRLNRSIKTPLDHMLAPSRNDEYAFYQNLVGVWPADGEAWSRDELINRMKDYLVKACREAKQHTSWITPAEPYENAVLRFVEAVLGEPDTPFIQDFLPFQRDVSWFGMLNSLSQLLLKLVSPGIPDIYQGNEIWRFCLVDPDNRRPIDFARRRAMLQELKEQSGSDPEKKGRLLKEMLGSLADGRAKMFVLASTLHLRNEWKEVFDQGAYLPLEVNGLRRRHLCALARKHDGRVVVAVAPRLYRTLSEGRRQVPLGPDAWGDTVIGLPDYLAGVRWRSTFSGETVPTVGAEGKALLNVADVLRSWPVCLLRAQIE